MHQIEIQVDIRCGILHQRYLVVRYSLAISHVIILIDLYSWFWFLRWRYRNTHEWHLPTALFSSCISITITEHGRGDATPTQRLCCVLWACSTALYQYSDCWFRQGTWSRPWVRHSTCYIHRIPHIIMFVNGMSRDKLLCVLIIL